MATSALATAFVNIVPGTVELEKYLRTKLSQEAEGAGKESGKKFTKGLSDQLKSAGSKMSGIGKNLALSVTAPLTAIGIKSIQTSADFGVAMASLQVNSGASGAAMEKMRDLAIKMGQDTVFSAGEAANAMLELSKGGMEPASISGGALQATMALAATEGMNLADAATIVTQSMNTFGLSAEDTMSAVDMLAAGAVASTAGVADLADGLKYVGSSASQIGVPMSDTVTALAALNNAGIDSTTAGTSLNRMILGLVPTTKKAKTAMEGLGVSFLNQDGSVKSLGEVVEILQDKMSGLTDAQRIKALKDMFGVEGMRAAATLLNLNADGWQDLNKQVTKGGVAGDLANARMSGLAGAIEQMKGSIDTAFLTVGDRLTPATTAVTGFITKFVNGFASLDPATQTLIVNIGLVAAAIGPALIFVGKMVSAVGSMITVFGQIVGVVKTVGTAIQGLFALIAANPIGALIVAIGLVVAGLVYFFTQTETGKKAWASFTKFLSEAWGNVTKFLSDSWQNIKKFFNDGVKAVNAAWDGTVKFFSNSWTNIKNLFNAGLKFVTDLFLNWTVLGWIIKNWGGIVSFFSTAWSSITGYFRTGLSKITTAVSNGIGDVVDWFRKLPSKILGAVGNLNTKLYTAGRDLIDGLIRGVTSMVSNVGGAIRGIADTAVNTFKSLLGIASPSKVFKEFGKEIGRGLVGGLSGSETDVKGTMKEVVDWITKKWEDGDLPAKGAKAAKALVTRYQTELLKLEKSHNKVIADLEKAQDDLANRLQEKSSYIANMASAFGSGLTISNDTVDQLAVIKAQKSLNDAQEKYNDLLKISKTSALDLEEARLEVAAAEKALSDAQNAGTTASGAIQQLKDRITKTKELQSLTTQLQAMGLDKNLIRQIVEAQAVDFAESIIAGGQAAVKELNVLADQADQAAKDLAEQVGSILFDEGIKFAQSVVAELKAKKADIEADMLDIAKKFAQEIKDAIAAGLGLAKSAMAVPAAPAPASSTASSPAAATAAAAASTAKSVASTAASAAKTATATASTTATAAKVLASYGSNVAGAVKAIEKSAATTKAATQAATAAKVLTTYGSNVAGAIKAIENAAAKSTTTKTVNTTTLAGILAASGIKKFATGGFVTGPTNALIGEAGPEVVYPLKDFERMMGLDQKSTGNTLIYNAAPNQSLDAEQALFQAMKRAKVVAGW